MGCLVMSYLSERKGRTPRSWRMHLPPSSTDRWLSSTSSKTGRFLYFFLRPPQQKEMHANPSSAATINIHPLSGWFFIFGHSPCLLAAHKGANTVWHLRGAFYFTFVQSPLPVTCLHLFYLFLLFLRFLCYFFLAYQTYFLFGRPPFDVP